METCTHAATERTFYEKETPVSRLALGLCGVSGRVVNEAKFRLDAGCGRGTYLQIHYRVWTTCASGSVHHSKNGYYKTIGGAAYSVVYTAYSKDTSTG